MSKTTNTATPPPTSSPRKPPTSKEIYDAVGEAMDDLHSEIYKMDEAVTEAEGALRAAEARRDFQAAKIRRLMALDDKIVDATARAAIVAEKWEDYLLREALKKCSGWKPLQEAGATDQEIVQLLQKWPERAERPYLGVAYFERGWKGWEKQDGEAKNLKFYIAASNNYGAKKLVSLRGQAIVAAARRLLGIATPKPVEKKPAASAPAKSSKKPAPAKKLTAKASTPAKPAAEAPKPQASPAPTKKLKQTFNQWKSTLLSILSGRFRDAPLPEKDNAGNQATLQGLYDEAIPPGDAAERWAQLTTKATRPHADAEPAEAVASSASADADRRALAADPNGTPPADPEDADRVAPAISLEEAGITGETLETLKEAFSYPRLQQSGTIKRLIQNNQGQDYAVMGMTLRDRGQPDVFSLVPVKLEHEYLGGAEGPQPESWTQRKKRGSKGKPPSLQGVRAGCEDDGETWVFVDVDAGQINVAIPKGGAAAADAEASPSLPSNVNDYLRTLEHKSKVYALATWKAHATEEPAEDLQEVRRKVDLGLFASDEIEERLQKLAKEAGIPWQQLIGDAPELQKAKSSKSKKASAA